MMPRRGDLLLVSFPSSDLKSIKLRPVLVVQADQLGTALPQFIAAMVTSNLSRLGHPSRVGVTLSSLEGKQSGLKTDSVIMADNLATILHSEVRAVLGQWPRMDLVDAALRVTLQL